MARGGAGAEEAVGGVPLPPPGIPSEMEALWRIARVRARVFLACVVVVWMADPIDPTAFDWDRWI